MGYWSFCSGTGGHGEGRGDAARAGYFPAEQDGLVPAPARRPPGRPPRHRRGAALAPPSPPAPRAAALASSPAGARPRVTPRRGATARGTAIVVSAAVDA